MLQRLDPLPFGIRRQAFPRPVLRCDMRRNDVRYAVTLRHVTRHFVSGP
jgi:hypothetical protein